MAYSFIKYFWCLSICPSALSAGNFPHKTKL